MEDSIAGLWGAGCCIMKAMDTMHIGTQFSRYPAGRYKSQGRHSGEEFRERFLLPVLQSKGRLQIFFDGTRGYGSSFLEEAFGGLVRLGFTPSQVAATFQLITSDESLQAEILEYINNAE